MIVKAPQACSSFLLNVVRTGHGVTLFKSSLLLIEIKFHNVASVLPLMLWLLLSNKFFTRTQANGVGNDKLNLLFYLTCFSSIPLKSRTDEKVWFTQEWDFTQNQTRVLVVWFFLVWFSFFLLCFLALASFDLFKMATY